MAPGRAGLFEQEGSSPAGAPEPQSPLGVRRRPRLQAHVGLHGMHGTLTPQSVLHDFVYHRRVHALMNSSRRHRTHRLELPVRRDVQLMCGLRREQVEALRQQPCEEPAIRRTV